MQFIHRRDGARLSVVSVLENSPGQGAFEVEERPVDVERQFKIPG